MVMVVGGGADEAPEITYCMLHDDHHDGRD